MSPLAVILEAVTLVILASRAVIFPAGDIVTVVVVSFNTVKALA